jgi:glycosyltransferase involved in cell wall biosynthesis
VHKRKAPNSGAPVCRNEGVELAKGKYVIFLDSDDFLAPFCLEQRVEVMEKNPSVDFGVFPTLVFNQTPGDSQILWNIMETQDPDIERFLKQDMPWQTTGPIWRKTALDRLGKWEESITSFQDWEYHLRACITGLRYMKFDEPDCFYRVPNGEDSIGSRYFAHENILSRLKAFKKVSALFAERRKISPRIRMLHVGLFVRNMVQLLDKDMRTEAEMMLQAGSESKIFGLHDTLLARRILKEGASWRYRKLIKWWSRFQWPRSIRYDYWDPVTFCSREADPN